MRVEENTKTMIVDGLRFEMRVEENANCVFYQQCSEHIYDSRNNIPFVHEMQRCWGCDREYSPKELANAETKIIKCQRCPKTFHKKGNCFTGERTNTGYSCPQHRCHKCAAKTSECGMILRCLGCQISFCVDCLPSASRPRGRGSRWPEPPGAARGRAPSP